MNAALGPCNYAAAMRARRLVSCLLVMAAGCGDARDASIDADRGDGASIDVGQADLDGTPADVGADIGDDAAPGVDAAPTDAAIDGWTSGLGPPVYAAGYLAVPTSYQLGADDTLTALWRPGPVSVQPPEVRRHLRTTGDLDSTVPALDYRAFETPVLGDLAVTADGRVAIVLRFVEMFAPGGPQVHQTITWATLGAAPMFQVVEAPAARALEPVADGLLAVADRMLWRYDLTGSLDLRFGVGGTLGEAAFPGPIDGLEVTPAGDAIVVRVGAELRRLSATTGALEPGFGDGGRLVLPEGGDRRIVMGPDGALALVHVVGTPAHVEVIPISNEGQLGTPIDTGLSAVAAADRRGTMVALVPPSDPAASRVIVTFVDLVTGAVTTADTDDFNLSCATCGPLVRDLHLSATGRMFLLIDIPVFTASGWSTRRHLRGYPLP